MRHSSLPWNMTPEQLADYIKTNKVDTHNHVEKIDLTPEEISQLEHESSLATLAILKLNETKEKFQYYLKKGTEFNNATGEFKPQVITIPPTKGLEKLEANRESASKKILQGYKEEITNLYLLPWPEMEKMLMVDIEGKEWTQYSRLMSADEVKQHGKPVLKAIRNQPPLSKDEQEELNL